jgi:hypothetical protein
MGAAAIEAGHGAAEWTHPGVFAFAMGTAVLVAHALAGAGQRQIMAAPFIGDAEVTACAPPLGAVGVDAPAAGAESRDEVRQFVAQGSVDFFRAESDQLWIHADEGLCIKSLAGCCAQARVPDDANCFRQFGATDPAQERARGFFEIGQFSGGGADGRDRSLEYFDEIKLAVFHLERAGASASRSRDMMRGRTPMVS